MCLHNLLYFAQRENIAEKKQPLFDDTFEAWTIGPVLPAIHREFRSGELFKHGCSSLDAETNDILEFVFDTFASKSAMTLSNIIHCEISWRNARKGVPEGEDGDNPMNLADIQKDAERYSCQLAMQGLELLRKITIDNE